MCVKVGFMFVTVECLALRPDLCLCQCSTAEWSYPLLSVSAWFHFMSPWLLLRIKGPVKPVCCELPHREHRLFQHFFFLTLQNFIYWTATCAVSGSLLLIYHTVVHSSWPTSIPHCRFFWYSKYRRANNGRSQMAEWLWKSDWVLCTAHLQNSLLESNTVLGPV